MNRDKLMKMVGVVCSGRKGSLRSRIRHTFSTIQTRSLCRLLSVTIAGLMFEITWLVMFSHTINFVSKDCEREHWVELSVGKKVDQPTEDLSRAATKISNVRVWNCRAGDAGFASKEMGVTRHYPIQQLS